MDAGTLISARYRLDRRLAAGGMGAVWVAQDELLGRPVALKLLHQNLADDEGFRRRFRAEARAAARISHPGVVAVYDYGEDADLTFLAMELVPGESLHEMLRRRGPLSPEEAMRIVAQAADALSDAHALGLVHRDVKPANLLVEPNGTVKVTDFGIVRAAGMTTATVDGSVLGTVAYMSPEQIRGERVEAASDVYSLGVVAYEALAGTRPFPAEESIAVALAHLHDPVPPLPDTVPPSAGALVALMLRKEPGARPTARRVAAQAGLLAVDPTSTGPETMPMAPITASTATATATATVTAASPRASRGGRRAGRTARQTATGTTHPAAGGTTRPTPVRTLRAALGAAAIAADGRDARRPASVGVVSAVVLAALVVALLLAAALPGSGPDGGASAASQRRVHHTAAVNTAASSTTTSTPTTTPSTTTSPVLATTQPTTAPGPGHGPPGGPAPGGPGPAGPGPGGPGPGGPGGPGH